MAEIVANFELNNNEISADMELSNDNNIDADFVIYSTGTTWGKISGDITNQTDLIDLIDTKIDIEATARENNDLLLQNGISTLNDDLTAEISNRGTADGILQGNIDTLSGTVSDNYTTLDGKIGDNKTSIDNHITDKTNPHEVTKAQVGLGNVDNTSDLNKPISTATQTALDDKQNTINDLSEIRLNASNGQSAYNTIKTFGDIVTYDASSFATNLQGQKADTALQPNDDISKLNNDAGYITSADVPTVNNSTITFQKNNITVGDINLNQANNETINFDIPSTASDVSALPDTTKYGKSIDIALNTTDYKLTISLKDQDGTVLNSKVVDFPLESVVVNGAYDSANKKVILTLQNGSTIEFSIADLISGLQTEITSTNKLDSDLVDDTNQTHKFVTASDKQNWNNKQDNIADLSTIRSGASAGATAVQPNDLSTVATSGSYNDLSDKPTIPTVPTNVSAFTNDSGYITSSALSGYATESWVGQQGYITGIDDSDVTTALGYTPVNPSSLSTVATSGSYNDLSDKPTIPTVGNGTITINQGGVQKGTFTTNQSGNTTIDLDGGGSDIEVDDELSTTSENPVQNKVITGALNDKQDIILDLSTIRSGASAGSTAIQPNDLATVATSGSYNDLADKPTIPSAVTESTVSGWGFTKNTGTVTSVNNVSPVNGNVSLTIPTVDQSFDGTSTNAESGVSILGLLQTIYPVGSVYLSTNATCPLASLFGTWTLVSSGRALWTGTGSDGDTTIPAGLPNITGTAIFKANIESTSGAFYQSRSNLTKENSTGGKYGDELAIDASLSNSIYGNSTTVQPPAYVVNVWRRVA